MIPSFDLRLRWLRFVRVILVGIVLHCPAQVSAESDDDFFESKIRPILTERCLRCHSAEKGKTQGGLALDTKHGWEKGGESGPTISPGNVDSSLLIRAVLYSGDGPHMPPEDAGGKLPDAEIALLKQWIQQGAHDPRTGGAKRGGMTEEQLRSWWSFQPLRPVAVPAVNHIGVRNEIDQFLRARLASEGLESSPEADRRTLIRRVTYDLTGLPPSPEEVDAFLADTSSTAYETVVERLLQSTHYGEHWGRHWLDVVRYADTAGENTDHPIPDAWRYRNWVIDAFNNDLPYDQFVREQIAGDLIHANDPAETYAAGIVSTGFLAIARRFDHDSDKFMHLTFEDTIDTMGQSILGLTIACARCHDHKFDPIPTQDYYSLYGVFANSIEPTRIAQQPILLAKIPQTPALLDYLAQEQALQKKETDLGQRYAEFRRARSRDPQMRRELIRAEGRLQRELGDLEIEHPGAPARANVVLDAPRAHDYTVLVRGETKNYGATVPRRFLETLSPQPEHRATWNEGSGRLQLARAIADPLNPITARVLVNRIWQQHFGAGFVNTPDDLGNMASAPTNPELLDWLADRFSAEGWSIKKLQRTIVLSHTYAQSSDSNAAAVAVDPANKYLWRANLHRLDFEEIYDALLATAGTLDRTIGGKSIAASSDDFGQRRSLYTYIDRRNPPELLTQFDFPNPDTPSGKRYATTVPQQSLFMMNSPLVIETARQLTHRPEFTKLTTDQERIVSLYVAILQRPPTAEELTLSISYINQNPAGKELEVPESSTAQHTRMQAQADRRARLASVKAKAKYAADQRPVGTHIKSRGPEDTWTKLAHALFQTTETIFIR